MKYLIYPIIIFQFTIGLKSFSEVIKKNNNTKNWDLIKKNANNSINHLNWKIIEKYNQDYFRENLEWEIAPKQELPDNLLEDKKNKENKYRGINNQYIFNISPLIPLNNFIEQGEIESKIEWKSSFGGGKARGIGQQNNSFKIDYGLRDFTHLTFTFSEADDDTYNYINEKRAQYSWQTYALSLKQKIWDFSRFNSSISLLSSFEYFRISSGSNETKSIFNEENNSFNKDSFGEIAYSFAIPFSKKITNKFTYNFVPGFVSLPKKLGTRTTRNNFYGNNFYIGNGITFDLLEDLTLFGSLTKPLGPGNNYFDKNLNFDKKQIYSFGMNWDLNQKISIETKITNGYGSTPATGILTIPSDNLPLYAANFKYSSYGKDTYLKPLEVRDKLMSFGGITVNNALIPSNGTGQYGINYDSNNNFNFSYSYSLSNIFQIELLNLGAINNASNNLHINEKFTNTYLDEDNFNIRIGGKLLLFSPQKEDALWTSLRTSVGRNESSNQGYVFSELMNTYRINNWLAANLSAKYFYSGLEKFGGFGASMYLNVTDKLQIIPEINYLLDKNIQHNNTIAIRYSFSENKSMDLYSSNALNTQDLGQLLKSKDNKIGIKLNLFY